MTHTYVILEVSAAAFDEIASKLRAAGYQHAFDESDGTVVLDMSGLALQAQTHSLGSVHVLPGRITFIVAPGMNQRITFTPKREEKP